MKATADKHILYHASSHMARSPSGSVMYAAYVAANSIFHEYKYVQWDRDE